MDSIQLKCFISVAKTLNFSEAARLNYVSQSSVSRYIKDFEKEFGVKLFERSKRDVTLTNEGKILLPYIQEIIDTLNEATAVINQINNGCGGRVSIAYDAVSGNFVTECLKEFAKKFPEITIDLSQKIGINEIIFNSSDFDFYFMPRDLLPDNEKFNSILTHSDSLSFILPSTVNESLEEIKRKSFILLSENVSPILYMEIMDIFRTFHFTPDKISSVDDVQSIFMKVQAGMGVSILPTKLAETYRSDEIKVVEFEELDTDFEYVMAWRKDLANPVGNLFVNVVLNKAEDYEDEEFVL